MQMLNMEGAIKKTGWTEPSPTDRILVDERMEPEITLPSSEWDKLIKQERQKVIDRMTLLYQKKLLK